MAERAVIDFNGQVAIVTGAYAMELARRGASVVVNDLGGTMHGEGADPTVADQVVAEIERAGGVAAASHDSVESAEGGEAIVRTAIERFGRLDAVVSNAGIFDSAPFDAMSHADWRSMLRIHLDGGFHLSQPAYRVMKSQGSGRFVFIASSAGLFGQPQYGILANTVLPFGSSRMVTETVKDPEFLAQSPFLNAIQPELVVPIVVFLASRACQLSHHNYSAGAGRFARVFVGLAHGWLAEPGSSPSADDIAAHLADVSATEPFTVPMSIIDEVLGICARLGITP